MNPQENEAPSFQLNRLPKVDPIKELELIHFLEKPIDSRDIVKTPIFGTKSSVPSGSTNIQKTRQLPKIVTMQGESQEELQKDWEKRFARFNITAKHNHDHHSCCRSHSSPQYPTLAQRQLPQRKDPLHIVDIETISIIRKRQIQGPSIQMSHLPKLRCLPTDLSYQKRLKR